MGDDVVLPVPFPPFPLLEDGEAAGGGTGEPEGPSPWAPGAADPTPSFAAVVTFGPLPDRLSVL